MKAKTVNDQLIAYRHRSSPGRTVVFVNPLGCDQSVWDGVIDFLGSGYGTLTYDLRGHGQSALSQGFGISDLAQDLISLLDALGLEDVIVCGAGAGGMIAQAVAAARPDLCVALILTNSAPRIGSATIWREWIEVARTKGMAAVAEATMTQWMPGLERQGRPDLWHACSNMLSRAPLEGYVALCAALGDADLHPQTAAISCPVTCLAGAADPVVPVSQVESMAKAIPGAVCDVLPHVGHLACLEAPDVIANLIESSDHLAMHELEHGMAVRRSVLGDAHVDQAEAAKTDFDRPFQDLITQSAWGTVWASNAISRRERSMITLALLAATGNFEEIPMHVRATARTGASPRDLQEVFQHVAIYAGVPCANHALKLAKATLAEMKATTSA